MTTLTLPSGVVVEIDDVLYKFVNDEVVQGTRKSADEVFGILGLAHMNPILELMRIVKLSIM